MYETLMYVHLATIVPCVLLGTILIFIKKGTTFHRVSGKVYMALMLFTATITLFMPAKVGSTFLGHFGWIHLLCLLTIWTVPTAYLAARNGKIKSHQRKMVILYIGAILIAGTFTLMPGRYLNDLLF